MSKKFLIYFIFLTFLFFSFILGIKYIIDPVGINNSFNLGFPKNENLDYRFKKFIEFNQHKPNNIILGGSRVHYLQTEDLNKYFEGSTYNLGASYSTLEEQYYYLDYAIKHFEIKNVLIGVNLYTFSSVNKDNNVSFDSNLFKGSSLVDNYFLHYLKIPIISYFKYYFNNKERFLDSYYINGSITPFHESITLETEESIRFKYSISGYKNVYSNFLSINSFNKNFDYLKKIIDLCLSNNINYYVFTTVVHNDQLNLLKEVNKIEDYYYWKKQLASITPYYDFMYNNSISSKYSNFIDSSHIKNNIYPFYLSKIFNDFENKFYLEDFGKLVDSTNIEEHILFLKEQNNF
jgi:hypothetical protein